MDRESLTFLALQKFLAILKQWQMKLTIKYGQKVASKHFKLTLTIKMLIYQAVELNLKILVTIYFHRLMNEDNRQVYFHLAKTVTVMF